MLPSIDFSAPLKQFVGKCILRVVEASPWVVLAGAVHSQVLAVRHNQRIAAESDPASTVAADLALPMSGTVAVVEKLVDYYWQLDYSIQYCRQLVARSAKSLK